MQTVDPLEARRWFVWKTPINWAISTAVFIPAFFLLMQFLGGLLAFIIVFVVVFCLFFYGLDKRAIGMKCPHCGQYIESNTPWICGNKDAPHRNDRVDEYPFINHCQHCGFTPKAYQCHHCFKLIFLSEDKQVTAFARCADISAESPKPEPVKKDEKTEAASELKKDIHVTELMVKKAELDVTLKTLNQNLAPPPKEKTAFEQLEEYYKGMMGNEDAAMKWHAAIDAEFPNDTVEREKRHRVVDQWMTNKS
jgi:hypothetical protein